ncbi:MAG: beta-hexosaminidase [Clostridiaceae bacterium]|jgi:beta-N-acetylhexosaminidase|nr:beta-hexosaminidase [Clostridiaceae bacterium]
MFLSKFRRFLVVIASVAVLSALVSCTGIGLNDSATGQITMSSAETSMALTGEDESNTTPGITVAPETTESTTPENFCSENFRLLRAKEILSEMSTRQKVGQMFFASWVNGDVQAETEKWHFGGIVLFAPDFEKSDPESVRAAIVSYQEASEIPMLIGVDEEGGTVVRISRFPQFREDRYMSPQALFERGGMDAIRADTADKSEFLLYLGINVNLAPVCDVSTDSTDFIFKRSFGKDAEATAEYAKVVVAEMKQAGIGCSLKHFPGYGNNADTHTGIAEDLRDYESFVRSDFMPFRSGIEAGAGSVMVSHNIIFCMDKELPASLSPEVHRILREELGFDGVIMTDDLSMGAIKDHAGDRRAAVLAILAGNDMLIGSSYAEQIPEVLDALQSGEIDEEIIDEAVIRILLWKMDLGLIE